MVVLVSQLFLNYAQSPPTEERARQIYVKAHAEFEGAKTNTTAAWEFGRAAFDLADFLGDAHQRNEIANMGIDACRRAIVLDPNSAPAHYYLALNLGQLAKSKKFAALRLLHEMQNELLRALNLDREIDYAGPDRSLGLLYLQAPSFVTGFGSRSKARAHLEAAVELRPDFPENRICLAEAYAEWGETKALEQQLKAIDSLMPKARVQLTGEQWTASWKDWQMRLNKLEKTRDRLLANPPVNPGERGVRRR